MKFILAIFIESRPKTFPLTFVKIAQWYRRMKEDNYHGREILTNCALGSNYKFVRKFKQKPSLMFRSAPLLFIHWK